MVWMGGDEELFYYLYNLYIIWINPTSSSYSSSVSLYGLVDITTLINIMRELNHDAWHSRLEMAELVPDSIEDYRGHIASPIRDFTEYIRTRPGPTGSSLYIIGRMIMSNPMRYRKYILTHDDEYITRCKGLILQFTDDELADMYEYCSKCQMQYYEYEGHDCPNGLCDVCDEYMTDNLCRYCDSD